jgi:nitrite reductase/ring-hydroxylating ferredoxin subunit/multimeric flavodoxin WrbA
MTEPRWHDLGPLEPFTQHPVTPVKIDRVRLAITFVNGEFGAISGVCNHAGGPLGEGRMDGDYIVCPWHNWKYHRQTGLGEPGYEDDAAPSYEIRVQGGHLLVNLEPQRPRKRGHHEPHPLARKVARADGPIRVVGISTTAMDANNPRYSGSDDLLEGALAYAESALEVETRMIKLNQLRFRHCEGYYSKSAHACTWPCSITQMDPEDQLDRVYEAVVHWGDVILVSTPIRWGSASSLYYKMVERMNCVQNQVTIANRVLLRNKVAGFIIIGGQDNVQAVAGQMLGFFGEIGCQFPQFPYIAHTRGWSAEDMERNVQVVRESAELREAAQALVHRAVDLAHLLVTGTMHQGELHRGGRKAHMLEIEEDQRA